MMTTSYTAVVRCKANATRAAELALGYRGAAWMDVADFDFDLPDELIAQEPPPVRGESRLLVLNRDTGEHRHSTFSRIGEYLRAGDLLVLNNTKVYPARLLGHRVPSGGAVEALLLEREEGDQWSALMHPGQKLKPGALVRFERHGAMLHGEVLARHFFGRRSLRLWTGDGTPVDDAIDRIGHVPLPPYIKREDRDEDRERYQTVFARERGSVAAPTAGLHFTPALLADLAARGLERVEITLHVGYGTFKPVRAEQVEAHEVDPETYTVEPGAADALTRARREGRRVIAVGTTTTRALESLTISDEGAIRPASGQTRLFIHPGHRFRIVNGLVTNFHLPRSSLLMLVAAFAGREQVLAAYREAVAQRYRFYSYGDAMLIV
jgi:S-adenosylmethionine:tRNA ribosyltransferase-isomerase